MSSAGRPPQANRGETGSTGEELAAARARIAELEAELKAARRDAEMRRRQLEELAAQYKKRDRKNVELQEEYDVLANLFVANYQLHGSVKREDVLGAIEEIIINLIGSEEFVIFEVAPEGEALVPLSALGVDTKPFELIRFGEGIIGRTAATEQMFVGDEEVAQLASPAESSLTACVPLRLHGRVTGAIAVFGLMQQKQDTGGLVRVDHELLGFLAAHAGTALYCSELHERAIRGSD